MSGIEFDLEELTDIGTERANNLRTAGFQKLEDIRLASIDELTAVPGISQRLAEQMIDEVGEPGPEARPAEVQFLDDPQADALWKQMASTLMDLRNTRNPTSFNDGLLEQAEVVDDEALGAVFRLWAADNLVQEKRHEEAIDLYEEIIGIHDKLEFPGGDVVESALRNAALAYERIDEIDAALDIYDELAERNGDDCAWELYRKGRVAEKAGRKDTALAAYRNASKATDTRGHNLLPPPELAARNADRLEEPFEGIHDDPSVIAQRLARALREDDLDKLRELASPTHFTVGPAGGCRGFVDEERTLARLVADAEESDIRVDASEAVIRGESTYVETRGWDGEWFADTVEFLITKSPQGWEWSGLVLRQPTANWSDEWEPENEETNPHSHFRNLPAPWPKGDHFMAGGLRPFIRKQAALAAAPFTAISTVAASLNPCGFGTRGFYYNYGPTHQGKEAFALDFTRYVPGIPYNNASKGTKVLSIDWGVVSEAVGHVPTGNGWQDNHVYVQHPGYQSGKARMRYESRYLHLEGPNKLRVSRHVPVRVGSPLGKMDNTGNSAVHHLHFSIRDINNQWQSVRPTPMEGNRLRGPDNGTCIKSDTEVDIRWVFREFPPLR